MHKLFSRANKKLEEAKKDRPLRDLCPYKHRPRCGMFVGDIKEGDQPKNNNSANAALPCTRIALVAKSDEIYGTFTQKMCFVFGGKDVPSYGGDATILIPVSEYGKLEQFECKINGMKVQGDVLRRDAEDDDSYYWNARKPNENAAAAASGNNNKEKELHDVFYFVGRHLCSQLQETDDKFKPGKLFEVELTVKVGVFKDNRGRFNLVYPLTAAPKLTFQEFTVSFTMPRSVRQIVCLNKGPIVHTAIRGRRAKGVVEVQGEQCFRATDHLFGFAVELGEPVVPQCADPVAIFVLVTFVGAMLFFSLTQNILDDTW